MQILQQCAQTLPGRRGRQWEERKLLGLEFCLCLLEGRPPVGSIQGDQVQLPTPGLSLFRNPPYHLQLQVCLTLLAPLPSAERGQENVRA